MKDRPLLSISMLVSGKSKDMWKSIESLINIKKKVSTEIILVDTGCTKEVHSQLEKKVDKLLSFSWCDDFAKARNTGLEVATGEWFMYLDDDEWFEDIEELVDFFQSGTYKKYGYACYKVRNYIDPEGTQYSDSWVERLARRTDKLVFRSRIHEFLTGKEGEKYYLPLIAEHYGYAFKNEEEKMKHFERNEKLLLEMLEEEPDNLRLGMQLVQEYRSIDSFSKMIYWGETFLQKVESEKASNFDRIKECFYGSVLLGYLGVKEYYKVIEATKEIERYEKFSRLAKTMAFQIAAKARYEQGLYEDCKIWCGKYIENYCYFRKNQSELVTQQGLPFVSEAVDIIKWKEVYSISICAGLRMNDATNLENYWRELHWEENNVYIFEDMADTLIDAFQEMEYIPTFYHVADAIWKHRAIKNYFIEEISERELRGDKIQKAVDIFKQVDAAEKIKAEIKSLEENGMWEQVEAMLPKIKEMLPYDEELIKM